MGYYAELLAVRSAVHPGGHWICAGWADIHQVLIARWFRERRGQAMGYAYLGLGLGEPCAACYQLDDSWIGLEKRYRGNRGGRATGVDPRRTWVTRSAPAKWSHPDGGRQQHHHAISSLDSKRRGR